MQPTIVVPIVAGGIALLQATQPRPPERPAEPFRVVIHAQPKGEPKVVERIRTAEKETRKALERRPEWFAEVSERGDAEIVLEIKAYWMNETMRREPSPLGAGVGSHFNIVKEHHYLQAHVEMFGAEFGLRADDNRSRGAYGGSVKGAARNLIDALKELSEKNYWQLDASREPR